MNSKKAFLGVIFLVFSLFVPAGFSDSGFFSNNPRNDSALKNSNYIIKVSNFIPQTVVKVVPQVKLLKASGCEVESTQINFLNIFQAGQNIDLNKPANCFYLNFDQKIVEPVAVSVSDTIKTQTVKVVTTNSFYLPFAIKPALPKPTEATLALFAFAILLSLFISKKFKGFILQKKSLKKIYTPNIFALQVLRC